MLFCVSTERKSTNEIRVSHVLKFDMMNTSRILTTFNAMWSHKKGKAVPLQAWTIPDGSRKLRVPDFATTAHDGGKVVSLTHRPLFTPRKYSWYSFLLEAESIASLSAIGRIVCQCKVIVVTQCC